MREGGTGPVAGTRSRQVGARLAVWLADALMRLAGSGAVAGHESISEAQLRSLVAASRMIDGEERRIIDEVLAAGARHVREVMVPRTAWCSWTRRSRWRRPIP